MNYPVYLLDFQNPNETNNTCNKVSIVKHYLVKIVYNENCIGEILSNT